jgi:predicted nucleic acid-binding protein
MIALDSSFLIACHNRRDVHHAQAARTMQEWAWGRGLLLEYVFLEVVTVLLARRDLAVASSVAQLLLQAKELEFVPCADFFLETVEELRRQKSGHLSFTDAAIVRVARERCEGMVATFDEDFRGVEGIAVVPAGGR